MAAELRKSAIDYCYPVDTNDFVNMNNMSEESNSVGDGVDMDEEEEEEDDGHCKKT